MIAKQGKWPCVYVSGIVCDVHILYTSCIYCVCLTYFVDTCILKSFLETFQTQGKQQWVYILWAGYMGCTWRIWCPDIFYILYIYVVYIWYVLRYWCILYVWWTVYILCILCDEHILYTQVYIMCVLHILRIHVFWGSYEIYVRNFQTQRSNW